VLSSSSLSLEGRTEVGWVFEITSKDEPHPDLPFEKGRRYDNAIRRQNLTFYINYASIAYSFELFNNKRGK